MDYSKLWSLPARLVYRTSKDVLRQSTGFISRVPWLRFCLQQATATFSADWSVHNTENKYGVITTWINCLELGICRDVGTD